MFDFLSRFLHSLPYKSNNGTNLKDLYYLMPPVFQNIFVSLYGLSMKLERNNKTFTDVLNYLNITDFNSAEKLEELQTGLLRSALQHAYNNIPYYKKIFDQLQFSPCEISSTAELVQLPLLTKNLIRQNAEQLENNSYKGKIIEYVTSGTTGIPLKIKNTRESYYRENAYAAQQYRWNKLWYGVRTANFTGVHIISPNKKYPPYWRYNYFDKQLFFSVRHISEDTIDKYLEKLTSFEPVLLKGYPSALEIISKYIVKKNIEIDSVKHVFCSSEPLYAHQRKTIEEAFSCKISNWYGNTELAGHILECQEGNLHIHPFHSIVEICDSAGLSLKAGKTGKIIATQLYNPVMPLIRYETGDLAVASNKKCRCGRNSPLVEQMVGREADNVITTSGKIVPGISFANVFNNATELLEKKIIQEKKGEIIVLLKKENKNTQNEAIIKKAINARVGKDLIVNFDYRNNIDREISGKLKFIENRIT